MDENFPELKTEVVRFMDHTKSQAGYIKKQTQDYTHLSEMDDILNKK